MRIIRNERRIRVLGGIGRYVPWIALLVLGAGLLISYVRPEWLLATGVSVVIGVVLVGVLIPLGLQFASMRAKREAIVGSVLTSTSLVLIGGFILRLVVVLGGQMV